MRGNTSRGRVFFSSSPKPSRKCFLFLLENSPKKIKENEENSVVLFIIKT